MRIISANHLQLAKRAVTKFKIETPKWKQERQQRKLCFRGSRFQFFGRLDKIKM